MPTALADRPTPELYPAREGSAAEDVTPAPVAVSDEVAVLTQMAEVYRAGFHEAIDALATRTRERDQARATNLSLREENRHLRADLARFTASQIDRSGLAA